MEQVVNGFTRRLTFRPAFDERHPSPAQNYGIHGVEMRFLLIGPKGVTQFLLYTNWQLAHVRAERKSSTIHRALVEPLPADLGYHALGPQYGGQTDMKCDLLPGGRCYYDESSLNAEPVFDALCAEGEAAVWARLEEEYDRLSDAPPVED